MKKITFIGICVLVFLTMTESCKKYEEGPTFSLRTKKSRLTGEWILTSNGVDGIHSYYQSKVVCNSNTFFFDIYHHQYQRWIIEDDGRIMIFVESQHNSYDAPIHGQPCPPVLNETSGKEGFRGEWFFTEKMSLLHVGTSFLFDDMEIVELKEKSLKLRSGLIGEYVFRKK